MAQEEKKKRVRPTLTQMRALQAELEETKAKLAAMEKDRDFFRKESAELNKKLHGNFFKRLFCK